MYVMVDLMKIIIIIIKNVHINNIKMLYYNKIEVSEGVHVNKTSASKECIICHYWHFLEERFKFQLYICKGYHIVLLMSTNLKDIPDLKNHGVDFCCIMNGVSKSKAVNLLQNVDLSEILRY